MELARRHRSVARREHSGRTRCTDDTRSDREHRGPSPRQLRGQASRRWAGDSPVGVSKATLLDRASLPESNALRSRRQRLMMLGRPSRGGMAMVQAFVLVQAGVGMASRVGQAVSAIQGVRSADIVTGPYDVVARVEAASIDALGRLVVSKIQAIEGITRTLTCPVVRL